MSGRAVPTLWLRCGTCADRHGRDRVNLATVSAPGAPRFTGHAVPATVRPDHLVLPGERLVIDWRRDGTWTATPVSAPDAWAHKIGCKRCGTRYPIAASRIERWWEEFAATGRPHDVRYLGRDR